MTPPPCLAGAMFHWMVAILLFISITVVVPVPLNMFKKTLIWARGIKYMALSKDLPKTCKETNFIPVGASTSGGRTRTVRVIFVRHGQSVWNSLFNSFGAMWPVRLISSLLKETWLFFTNPLDSLIFDSPLSPKGVSEAEGLSGFVKACPPSAIPHDTSNSLIICSNLRRAMATAAIGLAPRTAVTGERIVIDSCLQEGSRNVDALGLNNEKRKLVDTPIYRWKTALEQSTVFDPAFNDGNKSVKSNVNIRMTDFVRKVFGGGVGGGYAPPGKTNSDLTTIVVVGHSGYIRSFFRRFLPASSTHISKKCKLQTAGAVAFDLVMNTQSNEVYVEESTITLLHREFK